MRMCLENISAHERGSGTPAQKWKTGMSLCLEKVENEEMEGSVWSEVGWRVVKVQEIKMGEGGSQGSLQGNKGIRTLWLPVNDFEIEFLFFF